MGDMNLRTWKLVHGFREPVVGSFRVTAIEWGRARSSQITLVGVLSAPGLAPMPVSRSVSYPSGRHIAEGMDLPVVVDLAQPDKLHFLWKQVPTQRQVQAEQQARDMRQAAEAAARMAAGSPYGGPNSYGQPQYGQSPYGQPQYSPPYGRQQDGQPQPQPGSGPNAAASAGFTFDFDDMFANMSSAPGVSVSFSQSSSSSTQSRGSSRSNIEIEIRDGIPDGPMAGWPLGTATVRAAREAALPQIVAGFMMPGGLADVTLEISSPAQPAPYTVQSNMMFPTPRHRAMLTTPGNRLPVRIDPASPTHVVIDTSVPSDSPGA